MNYATWAAGRSFRETYTPRPEDVLAFPDASLICDRAAADTPSPSVTLPAVETCQHPNPADLPVGTIRHQGGA